MHEDVESNGEIISYRNTEHAISAKINRKSHKTKNKQPANREKYIDLYFTELTVRKDNK